MFLSNVKSCLLRAAIDFAKIPQYRLDNEILLDYGVLDPANAKVRLKLHIYI